MYTNANLLQIRSSFIPSTHSFPCHLAINLFCSNIFALSPPIWQFPQPASSKRDQSKSEQGKASLEKTPSFHTLKRISVVMVNPWVMMGSSSGGRPFQQSSSTQRQPASSVCRYISGEEIPENWPAAEEQTGRLNISYSHRTGATELSATLEQVNVADWQRCFRLQDDISSPYTAFKRQAPWGDYSPQPSKLKGRYICPTVGSFTPSGGGTHVLELPLPVKYVLCDELMK